MDFTFGKCVADVAEFHAKFGITVNPLDNPQQYDLRVKRQDEEFDELATAKTVADMADAVIDIIYVAAGTYHLLGARDGSVYDNIHLSKDVLRGYFAHLVRLYRKLPLAQLWEEVHAANMRKERGTAETSKYGNAFDIVKPEGWVPPNIDGVLQQYGIKSLDSASEWQEENLSGISK